MFLIWNFLPDPLAELGVGADLVADLGQSLGQLGLRLREPLRRVRRRRVDHRPRRQHEGQGADGAVGVRDDSAAHPARVVGEDAADAGDVGAGRVGPELAPVRPEHPVGVPEDGARLDARPRAVVEHLHPGPVPANVDQDPVALGLAVQAGAAGAEGDRHLRRARVGEDLGDVVGVTRHDDRLRQQPVRARVGGVADQVDHPGQDAVRPEQLDQLAAQWLGRPGGELVGHAVLGGLACLRRDPAHIRCQQVHERSLTGPPAMKGGSASRDMAAVVDFAPLCGTKSTTRAFGAAGFRLRTAPCRA